MINFTSDDIKTLNSKLQEMTLEQLKGLRDLFDDNKLREKIIALGKRNGLCETIDKSDWSRVRHDREIWFLLHAKIEYLKEKNFRFYSMSFQGGNGFKGYTFESYDRLVALVEDNISKKNTYRIPLERERQPYQMSYTPLKNTNKTAPKQELPTLRLITPKIKEAMKHLGFFKDFASINLKMAESAYKRLSRQYHPDKCNLSNANQLFASISNAIEVIRDAFREQQLRCQKRACI